MALLTPDTCFKALQDNDDWTQLMILQEELKTMPFGDVWTEYCTRCGVANDGEWFGEVQKYEREVLSKRGK